MGKIGIEWVEQYHSRQSNLRKTKGQAEGFQKKLAGDSTFNYGNDDAWDQDFEQSGVGYPPAGTDRYYVEDVDIAYFSGHGDPRGPVFGVANHDDGIAHCSEMRLGDGRLKWLVLDVCDALYDKAGNRAKDRWKQIFKGLHYLLGFGTNANDEDRRGKIFADYLNRSIQVEHAWRMACKETAGSDRRWAHLRADGAGTHIYRDHWMGRGYVSPDPKNPNRFLYRSGPC